VTTVDAPLAGQLAVVTGASRGVGRATARRLAADGAQVVGLARASGDLDDLAAKATGTAGAIVSRRCDVRSALDVDGVIAAIEAEFGQIDILINNAGVERVKPLETVSNEDIDATLDTNLRGTCYAIRAVLPGMRRRHSGHIVSVASTAGIRGFSEDAIYCASKFGVVGLMEALDEEVRRHGIRVTTICPGAIDTTLVQWVENESPYRSHFLRPDDVADAIAYAVTQPARVAVGLMVIRPFVEPSYSPMLELETMSRLEAR